MNSLHMNGVGEDRSSRMMAGLAALSQGGAHLSARTAERITGLAGQMLDAVTQEHDRRFGASPSFG